ncbi:thioredoxin-dependent thiol peroxidase [Saprospiraceae bacterium]|nr:thioredoxin-dependent thiol peroxidase [Saprospiraceae bacterium]
MIKIGDKVPSFSLLNQDEVSVSSEELLGQKYVLFFYPKDDSPGCTKEACSIRDHFQAISKKGYKVYGVSPDKEKKHLKFINKYEFQYDLLADTEKQMINDFGLWGPKKFMGKEITGVYRTTVLVNEEGVIDSVISKVVTKSHGEQVLNAIEELG